MAIWLFLIFFWINDILSAQIRVSELNKGWQLKNQNESIIIKDINLPSGVYSAYAAYKSLPVDSVLLSKNDVNMRWIANDSWTYYLNFHVSNEDIDNIQFINLTFHGIDTISTINLNGHKFYTNNMFVRYSFNVRELLKKNAPNYLEIKIRSPIYAANLAASQHIFTPPNCPPMRYNGECHMNFLRKMQASFAWDWGLAAPSMGIWKSVTLEFYDIAIMRDIDVTMQNNNDTWDLDIKVYLESVITTDFYANLTFYAVELNTSPVKIKYDKEQIKDLVITFKHTIKNENIELWWPNGYGKQKLYHLHFTLDTWLEKTEPKQLTSSQKSIRIGFRTIELIQNERDIGTSFYFRVNGIPIFMKGTNYIPLHILPEFGEDQNKIKHLLESVKYSHMNMIRIWGGGVYESDYFYDMADKLGILIWQDMMFACAMYPTSQEFLDSVRIEVAQNAKRIGHHASIAIIAANNENELALGGNWYGTAMDEDRFINDYKKLYIDTILDELKIISDKSRPEPLSSSPSNGNNSDIFSRNPQDPFSGDIHFYNYGSHAWNPEIYPTPRFSSEYGFQSFPAMSSWKKVLGKHDDLEKLMDHRQHFPYGSAPIIGLIQYNLPLPPIDSNNYTKALIYFSQIAQAMSTKIETEVYRKNRNTTYNTMGALYWQLNDVWIAPSWSSIDFFGNYKILHYWTKDFMAPLTIIAHRKEDAINIYVVRDTIDNNIYNMTITYNIYLWGELFPIKQNSFNIEIEPNSAKLVNILRHSDIINDKLNNTNCFIEFLLTTEPYNIISQTFYFPDRINKAVGIKNPNIKIDICSTICKGSFCSNSISITVDYPAIFVYLDIDHANITYYSLSDNGFIQLEPVRIVHLEFSNTSRVDLTESNIKILTVNQFM